MMHFNRKKTLSFAFMFFFSIFLTLLATKIDQVSPMPSLVINKEESALNFKADFLRLTTFGHSRLISSLLWITTMIESDIEHYKGEDNSWMYHRFKTISNLEPLFYKNYLLGGQYLSIVKDDIYGADDIYSLGLKYFSRDFWLNYHAGFNAAYEIGNYDLALTYYDRIYDHPLTKNNYPNLLSIINKIKLKKNKLQLKDVYQHLYETWSRSDNAIIKSKLADYLYSIKAEIDLGCLNRQDLNCEKRDFEGNAYIFNSSLWSAAKPWKEFSLSKKPRVNLGQ